MTLNSLAIETVNTPRAFAELRDEWNDLAAASADTVFLTHPWLSNWLRFLGNGSQPHVLVARDGDRLAAALPLARGVTRPGIRTLRFMGAGTLTPNHLDVLAYPEYRQAAETTFVQQLLDDAGSWDVIDLDKLPEDSETPGLLRDAFERAGYRTSLVQSAVCPYAQLPATYDEFFGNLSKSARRHTRERMRCIGREHPDHSFGMAQTEEELDRALDALITLHQARWEERGYAGSFADPRVIAFHRSMCHDALRDGFLRFYTLTENEHVMAAVLCYRVNGSVQAYSCAFESTWGQYRPGMVLGAYAIEQSIAEGAICYDHLEGDEAHKSTWAGSVRNNLRFQAFGSGLRGSIALHGTRMRTGAIEAARRALPEEVRESVLKRLSRIRASRPS